LTQILKLADELERVERRADDAVRRLRTRHEVAPVIDGRGACHSLGDARYPPVPWRGELALATAVLESRRFDGADDA